MNMKNIQLSIILLLGFISIRSIWAEEMQIYTCQEPPLNFSKTLDKSIIYSDDVTGLATDIVREILNRTKNNAKIQLVPWARAYSYAQNRKNVVLYSLARIEERENLFYWVGPIALKKAILFAKLNSGIEINDLREAKYVDKIGTLRKDAKEQYLKKRGFNNIYSYNSWEKGLQLLIAGRLDLWAITDLDAPIITRQAGIDRKEIEPVFTMYEHRVYIGLSKSTSINIVNQWQSVLDEIKRDGTFENIVKKWATYYEANWIVKDGMVQVKNEQY